MTITHTQTDSALAQPSTWTLETDALVRTVGTAERRLPLTDVHTVILRCDDAGVHYTAIVRGGGATFRMSSRHYRGVGDFEDRTDSWSPLVRELCLRLADRDDVRFRRGRGLFYMAFAWAMFGLFGVALGLLLMLAGPFGVCAGLVIYPFAFLGMLAHMRRVWPGRFDPRRVPEGLAPKRPPPVQRAAAPAAAEVDDAWHDNFEAASERFEDMRDDD